MVGDSGATDWSIRWLPDSLPQELRRKMWDCLEGNAQVGNLRAGHIAGDGIPDLFYAWIREWLTYNGKAQ